MNLEDVRIPLRMRRLPRFRGMPIPYTTFIDPKTGIPDFKVNDERKRHRAIARRWCAICGQKMGAKIAFIGGPGSIDGGQLFVDAGMHPGCAAYAWDVCPYIVLGRGHAAHIKQPSAGVITTFMDIPRDPPERMGMMITSDYTSFERRPGEIMVRAGKPESIVWRTYGHFGQHLAAGHPWSTPAEDEIRKRAIAKLTEEECRLLGLGLR